MLTTMSSTDWDDTRLEQPSLLKYNVHTPLQSLPMETIKQLAKVTALPLSLMMYNLHGDMNVGMSIRTASILGCSDVFIVGRRKYDRRPEVGAKNYIQIHRIQAIGPEFFTEHRLLPIFLEQGGTALEEFSFKPYFPERLPTGWKIVFVVGSESYGIPMKKFKSLGAPILSISQYGVMRSLNVSIAASILLYEYMKQWRASRAV